MTELVWILGAAAGVIAWLVNRLLRVGAERASAQARLQLRDAELAEVRRKAGEQAAAHRAQAERRLERARRAVKTVQEVDGRTYQGLTRPPLTREDAELELEQMDAELGDAFTTGKEKPR